jgi:hypothetical protein
VPFPADPLAAKNGGQGTAKDAQIEPEVAVLDIPDIHLKTSLPIGGVATVHLRPTGHARTNLVSSRLTFGVLGQVLDQKRSRSYQAHVASEDIPHLRQLVEARRPQEPAEWREPVCVRKQLADLVSLVGHRAELQQRERCSVQAWTLVTKEHRAPHSPADEDRERHQKRRRKRQPEAGDKEIEETFGIHRLIARRVKRSLASVPVRLVRRRRG